MIAALTALLSLLCSAAALAGAALALFGAGAGGRLDYYALLAGGSTVRLAALAMVGSALGLPAVVRSAPRRRAWSRWIVLACGLVSGAVNVALTLPALVAARSLGQPISLTESLLGKTAGSSVQPEEVTFASNDGWQIQADLYRPRLDAPAGVPAVVVVHGGGWSLGDKGDNMAWNTWLASSRGYLVLDIRYRLAPAADWRKAVADVQSAVAWLRSHAQELNVDSQRVGLLGFSAGGHLALLAAYTAGDGDAARPDAVVAFYPPTDLARLSAETDAGDLREVLVAFVGNQPGALSDPYRDASPIYHVRRTGPPTLLVHGTWDELVPVAHSERLAETLEQAGAGVQLIRVPLARHAFDMIVDSPASQLAREAVAAFLGQNLGARASH